MQEQKELRVKIIRDKYIIGHSGTNAGDVDIFYYDAKIYDECPIFKFIGAGDTVKVIYKKGTQSEKVITNITEWSVNKLRERIIKILKDAISYTDKARSEYTTICNKYSLTREGKETERLKAINKIAGEMARKTEEGLKLFDKKIEEINQEEQKELEQKNSSLQYQQMITEKAITLETLGEDIEKLPAEYLQQYLQEFANDPVALLVMQVSMKGLGMKAFGLLPPNNLGTRQEILQKAKGTFENTMENLSLIDDAHDMSKVVSAKSFLAFLESENDDFSIPIEEVWNKMNESGVEANGAGFSFNFRKIRQGGESHV